MISMKQPRPSYIAWTDGATSGNPGPSGWAVYMNGQLTSGGLPRATNNQAEMFAILQALYLAPAGSDLTIITDSQLAIGWLSLGYQVRHAHIARLIVTFHKVRQSKDLGVSFSKVKGHARIFENELVDKAARAASLAEKAAQADFDTTFGKVTTRVI